MNTNSMKIRGYGMNWKGECYKVLSNGTFVDISLTEIKKLSLDNKDMRSYISRFEKGNLRGPKL